MKPTLTQVLRNLVLITLLATRTAGAAAGVSGGSDAGNGGKGILLPNGEVLMADPHFIQINNCKGPEALPEEMRQYLIGAGQLLNVQGAGISDKNPASFLQNNVFNPLVEYCFVESLERPCTDSKWEPYQTPQDGTLVDVACTKDRRTYIHAGYFAKMNLREQSKLILHERLHAQAPNAPHDHINDFTTIVDTLVRIQELEQKGQKPQLTGDEVASIERAPKRIGQLGLQPTHQRPEDPFRKLEDHRVSPLGGGWVSRSITLDPKAYVDLTSVVTGDAGEIWGGAEIRKSALHAKTSLRILGNAKISRSTVKAAGEAGFGSATPASDDRARTIEIEGAAVIQDSSLNTRDRVTIRAGSVVQKSQVATHELTLGYMAKLKDVLAINGLSVDLGANAVVESASVNRGLWIGKDARLVSSRIEADPEYTYYAGPSDQPFVIREGARVERSSVTVVRTGHSIGKRAPVYLGPGAVLTDSEILTVSRFVNYGRITGSKLLSTKPRQDRWHNRYRAPDGFVLRDYYAETLDAGLRVDAGGFIMSSAVAGIDVLWLRQGAGIARSTILTEYYTTDDVLPPTWMDIATKSRSSENAWRLDPGARLAGVHTTWFRASRDGFGSPKPRLAFAAGLHLNLNGRICPKDHSLTFEDNMKIESLEKLQNLCEPIQPVSSEEYGQFMDLLQQSLEEN